MSHSNNAAEQVLRSAGVNVRKCMRCGKCTATCPAFEEMEYHPHQFVYMVEKGEIDKLAASPSIFKCLSCFACVDRCPRGVEPAKLVEAVRIAAVRKQGANRMTANDVPQMIDEDGIPSHRMQGRLRSICRNAYTCSD